MWHSYCSSRIERFSVTKEVTTRESENVKVSINCHSLAGGSERERERDVSETDDGKISNFVTAAVSVS